MEKYKDHWHNSSKPTNIDEYFKYKISYPIALNLHKKKIPPSQANDYLNGALNLLSSPFDIPQLEKGAKRIFQAIEKGEKIFIQGDYDCDGITSAVLISWVLESYGADVEPFVPNRLIYDYGITKESVKFLKDKGAQLIITADCGITANEAVDYANQQNIDIIITDHHMPEMNNLPKAFCIIDPLLDKDNPSLHTLAGVGVSFKLCHGFILYATQEGKEQTIDLREGLDLVAFGTIADFCPIIDENRILIKNGIRLISQKHREGMHALINSTNLTTKQITPNDIIRTLAPKINSAGRLGCPEISVQLFSIDDYSEACRLIRQLDKYNNQRRSTEKKAFKQALAQANESLRKNSNIIVVVGHNWHPGIIGIMTTKLTNRFSLPCILLSKLDKDNTYYGSGRSGKCNINLLSILKNIEGIESGGHSIAFGVSVPEEKIDFFKKEVYRHIETIHQNIHQNIITNEQINSDGAIEISQLTDEFIQQYQELGPFSIRTPAPFYLIHKVKILNWKQTHTNKIEGILTDKSNSTISFEISPDLLGEVDSIDLFNIIFHIKVILDNNGKDICQIIIKDIIHANETKFTT